MRDELNAQIAEANTFRDLPRSNRSELTQSSSESSLTGDRESFSGVIQRLVTKEKHVIDLQNELARLSDPQSRENDVSFFPYVRRLCYSS